jgi:hypothetical protein
MEGLKQPYEKSHPDDIQYLVHAIDMITHTETSKAVFCSINNEDFGIAEEYFKMWAEDVGRMNEYEVTRIARIGKGW